MKQNNWFDKTAAVCAFVMLIGCIGGLASAAMGQLFIAAVCTLSATIALVVIAVAMVWTVLNT